MELSPFVKKRRTRNELSPLVQKIGMIPLRKHKDL